MGLPKLAWFHPRKCGEVWGSSLSSAPLCLGTSSLFPHLALCCWEEVGSLYAERNRKSLEGAASSKLNVRFFWLCENDISFPSKWWGSSVGCQHDAPFQVASTLLYGSPEGDSTDSIRLRCQKMEAIEKVERREAGKKGRETHIQTSWVISHLFPNLSLPPSLSPQLRSSEANVLAMKLKHNFADIRNCVHCHLWVRSQMIL